MNASLVSSRFLVLAVAAVLTAACASSSPSPNASTPATPSQQVEAPLPADGIDYACTQDADCTVKNLGSCCGYNPRCMNDRSAPIPEQCPEGMMGTCGFPEISHCACTENRCVSMQGKRALN